MEVLCVFSALLRSEGILRYMVTSTFEKQLRECKHNKLFRAKCQSPTTPNCRPSPRFSIGTSTERYACRHIVRLLSVRAHALLL